MELYWYVFIFILATLFTYRKAPINNSSLFLALCCIVYFLTSIIVRGSGFDYDMVAYVDSMTYEDMSFYYLKEPVVWLGIRFAYSFFEDVYLTLFFFDLIFFCTIFVALRLLGAPQYAYFLILIFFPVFSGFQNIYRQLFAQSFFLLSFSLALKGSKYTYFSYALSVLSHNVSALFFPVLLLVSSKIMHRIIAFAMIASMPIIIYASLPLKSSAETGLNLPWMYVVVIFFVSLFFSLIRRHAQPIREFRPGRVALSLLVIVLYSALLVSPAGAERIGMFSLLVCFVLLVVCIDRCFRSPFLARFFFVLFCGLPIFISTSMRSML